MQVRSCVRCGSTNIEIYDCGYSSFNAGHACCRECSYLVNITNHNNEEDVIRKWNAERARLRHRINDMGKEIEAIEKMLADDKERSTR